MGERATPRHKDLTTLLEFRGERVAVSTKRKVNSLAPVEAAGRTYSGISFFSSLSEKNLTLELCFELRPLLCHYGVTRRDYRESCILLLFGWKGRKIR